MSDHSGLFLDLADIARQLEESIELIKEERIDIERAFSKAKSLFLNDASDQKKVLSRLLDGKYTFLAGVPREKMTSAFGAPDRITDYTVYATDGSQIDLDRNQSIPHYLLNISKIRLSYGDDYGADISSECKFNVSKSSMVIRTEDNERPMNSALLAIMRGVDELRVLKELCVESKRTDRTVALSDGTLIFWTLASKEIEDWVVTYFLEDRYLKYLNELRELHRTKGTITASYLSYPGSSDVVNVLRLLMCPHDIPNCDSFCAGNAERPCSALDGVTDRVLFQSLLKTGERSAIFESRSSILERYGDHRICFFYINIGDEIGRVEMPLWVAEDPESVDALHAVILDQCRKGDGYPVALSEAHEAAVVRRGDTEVVRELMRQELAKAGITYTTSAKARSKSRRHI